MKKILILTILLIGCNESKEKKQARQDSVIVAKQNRNNFIFDSMQSEQRKKIDSLQRVIKRNQAIIERNNKLINLLLAY